jgi:hypothetical protein
MRALSNYGYYGKACPYKDACTAPANQYEMILGTDKYMDVKESPMGRVDSDCEGGGRTMTKVNEQTTAEAVRLISKPIDDHMDRYTQALMI